MKFVIMTFDTGEYLFQINKIGAFMIYFIIKVSSCVCNSCLGGIFGFALITREHESFMLDFDMLRQCMLISCLENMEISITSIKEVESRQGHILSK